MELGKSFIKQRAILDPKTIKKVGLNDEIFNA